MALYFKNDVAEAQHILTGWWNQRIEGRWALGIRAPRNKPLEAAPPVPFSEDYKTRWLDYKTAHTNAEARFAKEGHFGCVIPEATAYLGPGSLNAFLGCPIDFQKDTLWFQEIYDDPEKVDQLVFDPDGFYWNWTKEALAYLAEQAKGRYMVTMPDLVEGIDILAELFGTNELLMHLLDCPEAIHRLLDQLDELYFEAYDALAEIIQRPDGSVPFTWLNAWAPGRVAKLQCDFSIMISPDMFEEFVVPRLRKQCQRLDYTVYHLDGPGAVRHLDALLRIPELDAIQWVPGAGQLHAADKSWWESVWRKVYAAGKSAFVHEIPLETVEPFVREFGQVGTQVIAAAESEDAAKRILDKSLEW